MRKRAMIGVEASRRIHEERAAPMRVVAEVRTSGSLAEHRVTLLDCRGEPLMVWMRADGQVQKPRKVRGFVRLLEKWLGTKRGKNG